MRESSIVQLVGFQALSVVTLCHAKNTPRLQQIYGMLFKKKMSTIQLKCTTFHLKYMAYFIFLLIKPLTKNESLNMHLCDIKLISLYTYSNVIMKWDLISSISNLYSLILKCTILLHS
jgi:hypothetical protein